MDKIDYIEISLANAEDYYVKKENILLYDFETKNKKIDCSDFNEDDFVLPLIESFLIVIDDYTKIINEYGKDFDVNKKNIRKISIHFENGEEKEGFANLTEDYSNKNQSNYLEDNRLFITIEDETL